MKSSKRGLRTKLLVGAGVLIVVLGLLPAYIGAYTLSGPSDVPTLLLGDHAWVMRGAYDIRIPYSDRVLLTQRQPSLGDLVQVASPKDGRMMFKRVAAPPGDRVSMQRHRLRINGMLLEYAATDRAAFRSVSPENHLGSVIETEMLGGYPHLITFTPGSARNSFAEVLVPPDHFFLLGDNRDESEDSRVWGPVPRPSKGVRRITTTIREHSKQHAGRAGQGLVAWHVFSCVHPRSSKYSSYSSVFRSVPTIDRISALPGRAGNSDIFADEPNIEPVTDSSFIRLCQLWNE